MSSPKRSAHLRAARITAAEGQPVMEATPRTSLQSRRPSRRRWYESYRRAPAPRDIERLGAREEVFDSSKEVAADEPSSDSSSLGDSSILSAPPETDPVRVLFRPLDWLRSAVPSVLLRFLGDM